MDSTGRVTAISSGQATLTVTDGKLARVVVDALLLSVAVRFDSRAEFAGMLAEPALKIGFRQQVPRNLPDAAGSGNAGQLPEFPFQFPQDFTEFYHNYTEKMMIAAFFL